MIRNGRDYGAELEAKFQKYLKQIDCYSHKFTDFKSLSFLIANQPQIRDKIPKAPCDRLIVYKGRSFFIELKHCMGRSFSIKRLKSHQIGALLNHERRGRGISCIVLGYTDVRNRRLELFIIRIIPFIEFIRMSNCKSITIEHCKLKYKKIQKLQDLIDFLNYPVTL